MSLFLAYLAVAVFLCPIFGKLTWFILCQWAHDLGFTNEEPFL